MKASVAYESPRSQKPKVKPLKWHFGANNCYEAHGTRGFYRIQRQKPNRRLGIFKWALYSTPHNRPAPDLIPPVIVKGAPMSLDDLSELKAFASSYDAMPLTEVDVAVVVVEPEPKYWTVKYTDFDGKPRILDDVEAPSKDAAIIHAQVEASKGPHPFGLKGNSKWDDVYLSTTRHMYASKDHSANESPTREEWEVVVHHAPAAHRGAILNMAGPGDSFEAGNKIILQGFHDDTQASNVAASIVKRYRVPVTTGPIRKSEANEANEGHRCTVACRHGASEAPRRRTDEERRYPLKWTDTPKGNSFAHGLDGLYYVTGPTGRPVSWLLMDPNGARLGAFASKQEAEDEAERVEFIERRNTRTRREYRDEEAYEERNPLV